MKILILANNDVGLYQFRKDLIEAMLPKHEVHISLPYGEMVDPLVAAGCIFHDTPIDRRGINPVTDFGLLRQFRKLVKQLRPDLVITYTIKPNIYGGMVCRMLGVPYAVNITGLGTAFQKDGLLKKLVIALYKFSLKKAKVVFFENSGNRQVFLDEDIIPSEKTCLLSGAGVNLEKFTYAPYPDGDVTQFLFIGRVMKEKGVDELFDAVARLRSEGFSCELDVLGYYEDDYADMIRGCEAAGWLHYHGFQNDVRPFIEKAHCFVLPSYHEGMANTNLESAAMGRPVITSDIPGCREAVVEGVSGLLCQSQNADSLYDAMKRFIALPNDARARMGKAGRQHMENVFDKKRVVAATVKELF